MNLETKVPTNDKRLDLSEFHKDICRFRGWQLFIYMILVIASSLGVLVANFLELEFWMVVKSLFEHLT
jgi:hypothetical protein